MIFYGLWRNPKLEDFALKCHIKNVLKSSVIYRVDNAIRNGVPNLYTFPLDNDDG